MYITRVYEYKENEIVRTEETLPDNVRVLKIMDILNAEPDCYLIRKSNDGTPGIEVGSSIWLKGNDSMINYEEVRNK